MRLLEYILNRFYNQGYVRIVVPVDNLLFKLCEASFLDKFTLTTILDERSAGYVAVGLYEESEQPILLISDESKLRNFAPAITEAYYRKFPILVLSIENRKLNNSRYPQDMFGSIYNVASYMGQKYVDSLLASLKTSLLVRGGQPVLLCVDDDGCSKYILSDRVGEDIRNEKNIMKYFLPDTAQYSTYIKKIIHTFDSSDSCFYIDSKLLSHDIIKLNILGCLEYNKGLLSEEGLLSIMVGASIVSPKKHFIYIGTSMSIMYDINSLGNRHLLGNVYIFIVDNNFEYIETIKSICATWNYDIHYKMIEDLAKESNISNMKNPSLTIIK